MASRETDLPSIGAFMIGGGARGARASSGAVAALLGALAADLVTQVARDSGEWEESGGALAQSQALRERALALATEVEQAYGAALAALERAVGSGEALRGAGEHDLGQTLSSAVEPLLRIAEVASDAAQLAALAARSGATLIRADAVAATMLATAAAEIAAHLVEVNLLVSAGDERCVRARELLAAAAASRDAARSQPR
jgi:formiminotetrahydrofolate cyclodeaminase